MSKIEAKDALADYYALDAIQRAIRDMMTLETNTLAYSESISMRPEKKKIQVKVPAKKSGGGAAKIIFYI